MPDTVITPLVTIKGVSRIIRDAVNHNAPPNNCRYIKSNSPADTRPNPTIKQAVAVHFKYCNISVETPARLGADQVTDEPLEDEESWNCYDYQYANRNAN